MSTAKTSPGCDDRASYDHDVMAWATEQTHLLSTGQFGQLEIEHIADEIEDPGKSERREPFSSPPSPSGSVAPT